MAVPKNLRMHGGDDLLFGDGGNDTAIFHGKRAQYTIVRMGDLIEVYDSTVNRHGYDGFKQHRNIEVRRQLSRFEFTFIG